MVNPATINGPKEKLSLLPLSLVADDLIEMERIYQEALNTFRPRFAPIVNHLRHYRGKRLRPVLLLLTAQACGQVTKAHHTLAAVVEMIHTATLVHDDVLDEASTRRHVATVNAEWGSKTSLLLGDVLFSAAFRLCSTVDAQACEWIGDATNRVCAGELLQVSKRGDLDLSEADYLEIVAGKTGALTECCTKLGAHYAKASLEVTQSLANYGRDLGIAFQVADDVLDLTGEEEAVGKTLGTDIEQQKLTLPLLRTLENLASPDAQRFRNAIMQGDSQTVLDLLNQSNGLESTRAEAIRYATQARRHLDILPPSTAKNALQTISDWAVKRDR